MEKQIEAAILTMHGMCGDLQGTVGVGTLPTLEPIDLPNPEGETDTPDSTNT